MKKNIDPLLSPAPTREAAMLSALLSVGFRQARAKKLAAAGSLCAMLDMATLGESAKIRGCLAVSDCASLRPSITFTQTDTVVAHFRPHLAGLDHERLYCILLDCRNRCISIHLIAKGGLVGLSVHPREILLPAIREGAAGFIIVHNHPSGDPSPSEADRELTRRVRQAGELIGIPLLDHVVIASGGAMSV